jgi:hypothetical protein
MRSFMKVGHAIPCVLAVAAIVKILAIDRFAQDLVSFELIPPWVRVAAIFGVPAIEIIPLSLCFARRPRAAAIVSSAIIGLYTGVVLMHLAFGIVPECACFGAWSSFHETNATLRAMLIRNALLLCASIASVFLPRRDPGH